MQHNHTGKHYINDTWPHGSVVYHVYPRSLQDSNGDGVGDLAGITSRLGHIESLGADTVWLSPFYTSPMADFGYDVANYCDVDPIFGTLEDFKTLLAEAHRRNIRIMVDLVPNHTSDEHEWFMSSKQSRMNKHADWYVWRDGRVDLDGVRRPPNNWRDALTGASAWEWSEPRNQYYLHSFHTKQPDLNWNNQAVREAIKEVMRFWLELGVDGFRVDAVYWMAKDPLFRDDPPSESYVEGVDSPHDALQHTHSSGWPALYSHLNELAQVLKENRFASRKRFMVTEAYPERDNIAAYMEFYGSVDATVAAPFNFEGVSLAWNADSWYRFLKRFHDVLGDTDASAVASYAFGNHDQPRLASRIGDDAARSAAVMLMTLPGMVFIYYGEEIGMHDVQIPVEKIQDPAAKSGLARGQGRDPERTPMQWSAAINAGVSDAEPWLPLPEDYESSNVTSQTADDTSILTLYRRLGLLRRENDSLRVGDITVLDSGHPAVLGYVRTFHGRSCAVFINFVAESVSFVTPVGLGAQLLSSNLNGSTQPMKVGSEVALRPNEALVFEVA